MGTGRVCGRWIGWAVIGWMGAAGCGPHSAPCEPEPPPAQSLREALSLWCNVDQRAGVSGMDDPLDAAQRREDWLSDHVKNPDAIYLRTILKVQTPAQQADELEHQARQAGLSGCRYAASLREDA